MNITPKNVTKHELVGLQAHIIASTDPNQVCHHGVIMEESREMLTLKTTDGEKRIPKQSCTFDLTLPEGLTVRVDGSILHGRPEDRMKRRLGRRW